MTATKRTVADPIAAYESYRGLWKRARAVCGGERLVKDADAMLDAVSFTNMLIPFSTTMTPAQYRFYKAEAELPGITAQFSRMLVGGLLRKQPMLTLSANVPSEAVDWIMNDFGADGASLTAFLDEALWEEIQTSRAWIFVDYPEVTEELTESQKAAYAPYPVLYQAESIINWQMGRGRDGKTVLSKVVVKGYEPDYSENEFHPSYKEVVCVHDLDEQGLYRIRRFGRQGRDKEYALLSDNSNIVLDGQRLDFIPAWPLNGSISPTEPLLTSIVDKEVALYNKTSRRNHLLYGAATYTPIVASDMSEESFDEIVNAGLGSWIRLNQGDSATVLATPTEALQDMDRSIAAGVEEIARLGVRMLSPETAQSGVALEIRNAAQTAQLGSLNNKVSNTMRQVILFMLSWRYGKAFDSSDVSFSLSADFNPVPLGADWLRLATEWYQTGLIPRSIWLQILKQNDIVPPEYDDVKGKEEIDSDGFLNKTTEDYADRLREALAN